MKESIVDRTCGYMFKKCFAAAILDEYHLVSLVLSPIPSQSITVLLSAITDFLSASVVQKLFLDAIMASVLVKIFKD